MEELLRDLETLAKTINLYQKDYVFEIDIKFKCSSKFFDQIQKELIQYYKYEKCKESDSYEFSRKTIPCEIIHNWDMDEKQKILNNSKAEPTADNLKF